MATDIFIDGAAELLVQGNFVRVNLVVNSPTERDAQNNPVREVKYQLIMTPQAVTELHRGLSGAINHLTEVGVLTRREAAAQPVAGTADV